MVFKFVTEVKKFSSGTFFINIPRLAVDYENAKKGDAIAVGIQKLDPNFDSSKNFYCPACQYRFCSSEDLIFDELSCPACKNANITEVDFAKEFKEEEEEQQDD